MNGKTAKKIKKAVYGDEDTQRTATYAVRKVASKKTSSGTSGQIILTPGSKRAKYQAEKKAYKAFARNGRKTNVQTRKAA